MDFVSIISSAIFCTLVRRKRSDAQPPPRIRIGLPLIWYWMLPLTIFEVTSRMPNVVFCSSDFAPATVASAVASYSGCAPIWYGHQTCGLLTFSVNVTVLVSFAARLTFWL